MPSSDEREVNVINLDAYRGKEHTVHQQFTNDMTQLVTALVHTDRSATDMTYTNLFDQIKTAHELYITSKRNTQATKNVLDTIFHNRAQDGDIQSHIKHLF